MRILAVTPYYEPEGGGLERYAHAVLHRLQRLGHEVRVVAETTGETGDHIRDGVRISLRKAPMRLGNAPIDPGLAKHLRRVIQAWRPDVILGHGPVPFPAETAAQVAKRSGIPYVLTYHSGRLRGSNKVLDLAAGVARWTVEERMFRRSDHIIAVSPFVRDHALLRHTAKVTVIPPGVDACFRPAGATRSEILFVAPLDDSYRWKGVDDLIAAYRIVARQHPEVGLHLVGDGNRLAEFQALHAEFPLLRIDTRLTEPELIQAYQDAAVVALPSVTDAEAFGMVLAEANACGTPVIGARIGGIPDFVVDGDNGLLVEPGDAVGLAQSLLRLLQAPDQACALGAAGRRRILHEHDWAKLTRQTEAVLQAAVGPPPSTVQL